jgi:hypothetical protein
MPEKETLRRARKAKQEGKAPSTQAGAFVKEKSNTFGAVSMARGRPSKQSRSGFRKHGVPV